MFGEFGTESEEARARLKCLGSDVSGNHENVILFLQYYVRLRDFTFAFLKSKLT